MSQAFIWIPIMGPPPDLYSTGALRAVSGASKWSYHWGWPGWREARGPITLPVSANMPLLGLCSFFHQHLTHS